MCCMYVKLRGQVALRGQKVHGKRKLRIQGRMQIFEKKSQSALNHVLILQKDRTQKMLQIPLKVDDLQNDFNILYGYLYGSFPFVWQPRDEEKANQHMIFITFSQNVIYDIGTKILFLQ